MENRLSEWKKKRRILLEEIVVLADTTQDPSELLKERFDIKYAADSIILEEIFRRFKATFKSPDLNISELDFYRSFYDSYEKAIRPFELKIFNELLAEVYLESSEDSPLKSAITTADLNDNTEYLPPSQVELYLFLPMIARAIEEAYFSVYPKESRVNFIKFIKVQLPRILVFFASMNSVLQELIAVHGNENYNPDNATLNRNFIFKNGVFIIDEKGNVQFNKNLIDYLRKAIIESDIKTDPEKDPQRSDDRRCPFAHSDVAIELAQFATEEFIKQYSLWFKLK